MDVSGLKNVDTEDWREVIIINSVMMDKMNSDVRDFISRPGELNNVLVMATSGGGDFRPAGLAVDAITTASRKSNLDLLSGLIVDWAESEKAQPWEPADYVSAMAFVPGLNVRDACDAIRQDSQRYNALHPELETSLNGIGYYFAHMGELESALQVLRLNVDLFPESWNVYDSYAETLLKNGDRQSAISNYQKSLALNPESQSAKNALADLGIEN